MMIDGLFRGMDISTSALMAERTRMDVTAQNLANIHTTGVSLNKSTNTWEPYRRKVLYFAQGAPAVTGSNKLGVRVMDIKNDTWTKCDKKFDPASKFADKDGYVLQPNVDLHMEMGNMMMAQRAYEANATAFEASKNMIARTLRILV